MNLNFPTMTLRSSSFLLSKVNFASLHLQCLLGLLRFCTILGVRKNTVYKVSGGLGSIFLFGGTV